jgi:hypothetical protein
MDFEIVGAINDIETIAARSGIRELVRLRKRYGRGRWRKRKGYAEVRLIDGTITDAELHWYEAYGNRQARVQDQALPVRKLLLWHEHPDVL